MLFGQQLKAQEAPQNIIFRVDTHNFGAVNAREGDLVYRFEFTNPTEKPVQIKRIAATCGCTIPHWTQDTILPGGNGTVDILLRMDKVEGYFSKIADVYSNLSSEPVPIQVTGRVLRNYRYNDPFKHKAGHLLANDTIYQLGKVNNGKEIAKDIKFINNTLDTVTFLVTQKPKKVKIEQTRNTVAPGGNVMITLTIDKKIKKRHLRKLREIEITSILPQKKDTIVFLIPIKKEFIK